MNELKNEDFPMKLVEDLGMEYSYPDNPKGRKYRFVVMQCSCGHTKRMQAGNAKRYKNCKRCGQVKHGDSGSRLYTVYNNMIVRTTKINSRDYPSYGGRGITVCEEWKYSYEAFRDWSLANGYEYKTSANHHRNSISLDRIDNDKGYYPENCRWVKQSVQCENQNKLKKKTTSIYRGVNLAYGKWLARITHNKNRVRLGLFESQEEAAIAYNNYAISHKTNHKLNIIK